MPLQCLIAMQIQIPYSCLPVLSPLAAAAGHRSPSPLPPASPCSHHGFLVKPEFRSLYSRFAPIYAAEERERSERWAELMGELAALVGRWEPRHPAGLRSAAPCNAQGPAC